MAEDAKASTQYGDVRGTIAIDGHSGLPIDQLVARAAVPSGYRPIGLRIYGFSRRNDGPTVNAKVLCVDTDQTGTTPDEIQRFGRKNGELHTFEFDADVDFGAIVRLIKRYDVVLLSKLTSDCHVKIQPIHD